MVHEKMDTSFRSSENQIFKNKIGIKPLNKEQRNLFKNLNEHDQDMTEKKNDIKSYYCLLTTQTPSSTYNKKKLFTEI